MRENLGLIEAKRIKNELIFGSKRYILRCAADPSKFIHPPCSFKLNLS
jgi:hypothetical protein